MCENPWAFKPSPLRPEVRARIWKWIEWRTQKRQLGDTR